MQKIDQVLNRFTTIPKTPTNSGESTSRIQTRSSKAINALGHDSNESSSDQSDDSGKSSLKVSPIMTNSITKWKGLTKPSAYGYNHVSAPDLALKERELGFVSFNANNVYKWNIDGKTEYDYVVNSKDGGITTFLITDGYFCGKTNFSKTPKTNRQVHRVVSSNKTHGSEVDPTGIDGSSNFSG
ncbi:uncharacterized protein DS421_11g336170 [Arachis hypogaea]|nr:uncharacterized protein DS421_11g336170 [Arachis hypogaea]